VKSFYFMGKKFRGLSTMDFFGWTIKLVCFEFKIPTKKLFHSSTTGLIAQYLVVQLVVGTSPVPDDP